MQTLLDFGVSVILALQSMGDWLILPMRFFSFLGTEDFYLLLLPLLYWSIDSALGIRVGLILLTSEIFNYAGKLLFAGPRPYWYDSRVRGLWAETSFGVPSGHAQLAASVWGMAAVYFKQAWVRIGAVLIIFFIGVSRLYLGSHFPHDVVAGWVLGALILWLFVKFWEPVAAWLKTKPLRDQVLAAFLVSVLFIAIGYGAVLFRAGYEVPQAWVDNALHSESPEETPEPVNANGPFTSAGVFFGLAAGLAWMESLGGFEAAGSIEKRAFRYVVGLIGVAVFYIGLGKIFPRGDALIFYALRYIRYALVGWWVSGGAPWVFKRINLI